ncbi:EamA family transporter [Ramlibacter sp. AW1]|uniref:EamA family transporter n=1 Tax=Ramlibacter aurantiacus TaxID=2801330 RepID=A0A937D4N1_9BURK|nr:EamA family transporter [Ramlibacter aurantiacus]MBL0419063.1 EamA family transporter [Ramlibacter aurantiacus]
MTAATSATAHPSPLERSDLLGLLLVVVIWGLNFVVMKVGLASFTPFQMGAGRYVFAFLPLALLVRRPAVRTRWIVIFGLLQGVGQFGLLFLALKVGMTAALASVLLQTQVFFSALFGLLLLHERVARPLMVGLVFAAAGLACFLVNVSRAEASAAVTGWGLLLTLAASAMWAASNIVVRLAQREGARFDPLAFVVWCSAVPIVPFVAMSWIFDAPATHANWLHAPWIAWATLAFLGWMATDLAYGLWTRLLKRFPANRVAPFSLAVPLIGLAAGILLLGEPIAPLQWLGALLVLCALLCVVFGDRLRRRPVNPPGSPNA